MTEKRNYDGAEYNNEEPAKLTQAGAAIYNTLNGLLAGNQKIQVDYIDENMIQMLMIKPKQGLK